MGLNMARKWDSLLFTLLHLALFPYCQSLDSESTGFSLKLTRRDFPHSYPFHRKLDFKADTQRVSASSQDSASYASSQDSASYASSQDSASYLQSSIRKIKERKSTYYFPDAIHSPITRSGFIFTIDASIGTPSSKKTFIFDPGSELTWTQCTPCINCFKQDYPLFDPRKSTSYRKLSPNHTSARYFRRSNNGDFVYYLLYGSGESSSGIVSVETFSFPSDRKVNESINRIVFGCANNQRGQFRSSITGIMGMSRSPLSLIGQMGSKSRHRFSYCLPPINSPIKATLLRFGSDVKGRGLCKTSFLNHIDYNYRVPLLDISIAGRRLNLPASTFPTGCMLDIGCSQSYIEKRVYNEVVRVLMMHLNRFNLTRIPTGSLTEGGLCYRLRWGFSNYPNMTFHFQGANFEIGPQNLFYVTRDHFCLAMSGSNSMTILGAFQQQNVRFIYDIGYQKFLFAKEDCSKDKA